MVRHADDTIVYKALFLIGCFIVFDYSNIFAFNTDSLQDRYENELASNGLHGQRLYNVVRSTFVARLRTDKALFPSVGHNPDHVMSHLFPPRKESVHLTLTDT